MRRPPELAICHPACKQGREVSSINAKIIIVKEGGNNQPARHQLCHRPPPTHFHHLKKKISGKVPRGAKPASPLPPRGARRGSPWGAAGSRPRRTGWSRAGGGSGHPGNETPGAAARPPFSLLPRAGGPERKETRKRSAEKGSSVLPLPQRKCNSEVLPEPPPPASARRPHARRVGRGEAGPGLQSLPRRQPRRRSLRAISADSYMGGGQRLRRGIMK